MPDDRVVKSYVFAAVVEPDEGAWRAYLPALEEKGAATWGPSPQEALRNLQEIARMIVEDLLDTGEPLPAPLFAFPHPVVVANVRGRRSPLP